MKLPIIYHTRSLKGETEKHLVLLLFKHMIAEHSHPGGGFKRWCVWKGPARKPVQPNAGSSLRTLLHRGLSHARWGSSPRGLEQLGVVHTLMCVETPSLLRSSPAPSWCPVEVTVKVINTWILWKFPLLPLCWRLSHFSLFPPGPLGGLGPLSAGDSTWASTRSPDAACLHCRHHLPGYVVQGHKAGSETVGFSPRSADVLQHHVLLPEQRRALGQRRTLTESQDMSSRSCSAPLPAAPILGSALGKWGYFWDSVSQDSTPILRVALLPTALNTISVLMALRPAPLTRPFPWAWEQMANRLLDTSP